MISSIKRADRELGLTIGIPIEIVPCE